MAYFSKFPSSEYKFGNDFNTTTIPNIFRQIQNVNGVFRTSNPFQVFEIDEQRPDQLSYELYDTSSFHWTFFLINDTLRGGISGWPKTYQQLDRYVEDTYGTYKAITFYRQPEDDINHNAITNKFPVGSIIKGNTSGNTATVIARYPNVNQIIVEFSGDEFLPAEIIFTDAGDSADDDYDIELYKNAVKYYVGSDKLLHTNFENIRLPQFAVSYQKHEQIANDEKRYIRVIKPEYISEFNTAFRRLINE